MTTPAEPACKERKTKQMLRHLRTEVQMVPHQIMRHPGQRRDQLAAAGCARTRACCALHRESPALGLVALAATSSTARPRCPPAGSASRHPIVLAILAHLRHSSSATRGRGNEHEPRQLLGQLEPLGELLQHMRVDRGSCALPSLLASVRMDRRSLRCRVERATVGAGALRSRDRRDRQRPRPSQPDIVGHTRKHSTMLFPSCLRHRSICDAPTPSAPQSRHIAR